MRSSVRFEFGDMFETPSDLVVIPCSAGGTTTERTREHLSQHDIPLPKPPIPLGTLQLATLEPGHRAFRRVAFAASVSGNASSPELICALGERIGEMTRQAQIRIIAAPLFGTGAGGLDVVQAATAIHDGFMLTAVGGARLLIHVLDRADFAVLDRLELDAHVVDEGTDEIGTRRAKDADPRADHRSLETRRGVFISYSHKDRRWLDQLRTHLRPLERDHHLAIWDDTRIRAGTQWREEIRNAIANARVAILLVSSEFLASDFIHNDELPPLLHAAREEGAVILPVIINPCRFVRTENLAGFQAVNDPDKPLTTMKSAGRDRTFLKVVDAVEAALVRR